MNGAVDRFNFVAGRLRLLRAIAADSKLGWSYWRAAENDEKNGYPFAAAMEWHRAAQCFRSISFISEYCWREWERIVHLPRHFANPIGECEEIALPCAEDTLDATAIANAAGNIIPAASAA